MTRQELASAMGEAILHADISLLEQHGVEDDILGVLGLEHLMRAVALFKASNDIALGRNLLTMAASACLAGSVDLQNEILRQGSDTCES